MDWYDNHNNWDSISDQIFGIRLFDGEVIQLSADVLSVNDPTKVKNVSIL